MHENDWFKRVWSLVNWMVTAFSGAFFARLRCIWFTVLCTLCQSCTV